MADSSRSALAPFGSVTSAADDSNCLPTPVRHDRETSGILLKCLDKAIGLAWPADVFADEVNGSSDHD
jgi:hypothetical protein